MDNITFIIAALISCCFGILKVFETRFIEHEMKPLKFLIRDTIFVYVSAFIGQIAFKELFRPEHQKIASTPVFTGSPDF
jgi:hypothetical protein